MKVLIVTDQRVLKENDRYYTEEAFFYVLDRYAKAFENVTLYAKTGKTKKASSVEIENIPIYQSGSNIEVYSGKNKKQLKKMIPTFDFLVVRVPSVLANQAARIAKRYGIPYLSEAMGCAWDQLWNHGVIGKILAPYMYFSMRKTVKNASYASYVTREFLQKRYPCTVDSIAASNVMIIPPQDTVLECRIEKIERRNEKSIVLMTAGGVNVKYKGFQYVIGAIPLLLKRGYDVQYYIVGAGDQSYLKSIAEKHGVSERIVFTGAVSHDEVLNLMDMVDIYVQPSLQEGLPRTVIEAMSRGCPAIGARTAGIPELIPQSCVFKRKSSLAIANTVHSIISTNMLKRLAVDNFTEAQNYYNDTLNQKRSIYFKKITDEIKQNIEASNENRTKKGK